MRTKQIVCEWFKSNESEMENGREWREKKIRVRGFDSYGLVGFKKRRGRRKNIYYRLPAVRRWEAEIESGWGIWWSGCVTEDKKIRVLLDQREAGCRMLKNEFKKNWRGMVKWERGMGGGRSKEISVLTPGAGSAELPGMRERERERDQRGHRMAKS